MFIVVKDKATDEGKHMRNIQKDKKQTITSVIFFVRKDHIFFFHCLMVRVGVLK